MNESDQDVLRQYKTEADESLFENLHFDFRMKEQVMQRVLAEQKQLTFKKQFHRNWRKWIYSMMVAAAITGFILVATPLLEDDIAQPPVQGEITPLSDPPEDIPMILKGDSVGPMVDNGQTDPAMQTWLLETTEEARMWFGDSMALPSYTPAAFELDTIHATGHEEGIAAQVTFSYVSENRSFVFSQQKQNKATEFHDFETIDINGIDGFLTTSTSNSEETEFNVVTEIQWFEDEIQFTVVGLISEDEALRVARSIQ
jgi:hypothetical protein